MGKFTIWAAKRKAPTTPMSGTCFSSRSFPTRAALSATAAAETAPAAAHTGAERKPSGMCRLLPPGSTKMESCYQEELYSGAGPLSRPAVPVGP